MKRSRLLAALAVGVVVGALLPAVALAKGANVDVCHRTGNGSFHLITVSENAVQKHLAHGDGLAFGNDCSRFVGSWENNEVLYDGSHQTVVFSADFTYTYVDDGAPSCVFGEGGEPWPVFHSAGSYEFIGTGLVQLFGAGWCDDGSTDYLHHAWADNGDPDNGYQMPWVVFTDNGDGTLTSDDGSCWYPSGTDPAVCPTE